MLGCPAGGAQAFYAPSVDEVHLPEKSAFESAFEYHAVILHEAAHSTLAAHRMNRREAIAQRWGDEAYAVEELRAQICSAILAAETGVPMSQAHIMNHAAYLNGWLKAIKRDPMALFTAAKDAEKMADYMLGLEQQAAAVAEHAEWVADYDRHLRCRLSEIFGPRVHAWGPLRPTFATSDRTPYGHGVHRMAYTGPPIRRREYGWCGRGNRAA